MQGGPLSESRSELRAEWGRHRQAHGTQRVRDEHLTRIYWGDLFWDLSERSDIWLLPRWLGCSPLWTVDHMTCHDGHR